MILFCDTASVWDGGCWLDEVLMNDGGWFGDGKMNTHWRDSVHCKKMKDCTEAYLKYLKAEIHAPIKVGGIDLVSTQFRRGVWVLKYVRSA